MTARGSNPMKIEVTNHAKRRFKQRCGLPARATRRAAERAFRTGTRVRDLPWVLREELHEKIGRHDPSKRSFVRIHNDVGFVFAPKAYTSGTVVLITVLPQLHLPE